MLLFFKVLINKIKKTIMGCNCGKKKVKIDKNNITTVKKGTMGSRIKKIWKLSDNNNGVVVKKIDKE